MTVAIYSRKSKFTGKGESIANQVEICKQRVQQYLKDIKSTEVTILIYEDEGFSGKNTTRPEFQKMLSSVKADKINCVVCYKLDRISRNVGDFAQTYEIFEKHNVDFLCAGETYDTTTPAGRAMMGMVSVFAQMEREVTAERIKDNMHMLARTGRWLGGHTPTGFQSQKEERADSNGKIRSAFKLIPINKELELVKFIYDKFLELQSISGTTRYLIKNNIRTKNGNDFTNSAVKEILRNPVYCVAGLEAGNYFRENGADICFEDHELDNKQGFMPYNRTSNGRNRQVKNNMKRWLIAVGKHSGIIAPDAWVKAQQVLDAKRAKVRSVVRTPYKSNALLSGLLVCGECGSAMRPHVHSNRINAEGVIPYYYICELKERSCKARCEMNNINGTVLDEAVLNELMDHGYEKSYIQRSLDKLKEQLAVKKEPKSGFLESELEAKQRQIDKLLDILSTSDRHDIFSELTRQKVNTIAQQCKELENEIKKSAPSIHSDYDAQVQDVINILKDFKQTIFDSTSIEKREFLKTIISRIVWDGKQAQVL